VHKLSPQALLPAGGAADPALVELVVLVLVVVLLVVLLVVLVVVLVVLLVLLLFCAATNERAASSSRRSLSWSNRTPPKPPVFAGTVPTVATAKYMPTKTD
jgi:hypothetical protein